MTATLQALSSTEENFSKPCYRNVFQITLMVVPGYACHTPMTHDYSTRNAGVASVVNPSARAVLASLAVVVLGPVMALVVASQPMLGVGVMAGLLARPAVGFSRRVTRHFARAANNHATRPRVAVSGASLDAGAE